MGTYTGSDKRLQYLFQNGGGGGASSLAQLSDVQISNPMNGETLVYDETAAKWKNGSADSTFRKRLYNSNAYNSSIVLSESYTNFYFLLLQAYDTTNGIRYTFMISTMEISAGSILVCESNFAQAQIVCEIVDNLNLSVTNYSANSYIESVFGIGMKTGIKYNVFQRISNVLYNSDSASGGTQFSVTLPTGFENITKDNLFLDLRNCQYSGSRQYTSTTQITAVNTSTQKVTIKWGEQSGTSRQGFYVCALLDTNNLKVLSDWATYNNNNKVITVQIPDEASNLTADDFIVDFKSVITGGTTMSATAITKEIQNGNLVVTLPLTTNTSLSMQARILYAVA